jgi:hypothetical protein
MTCSSPDDLTDSRSTKFHAGAGERRTNPTAGQRPLPMLRLHALEPVAD